VSEELDLIVNAVRRFVRREIWLEEKRIDSNAPRLPVDTHAKLLNRATELDIAPLMAPRGSVDGPQIDLPDADRLRIAEELSQQLEERDQAIVKLQSEFEDRTQWALRLDAELQQARSTLEAIRQSRRFKLARLLGLKE